MTIILEAAVCAISASPLCFAIWCSRFGRSNPAPVYAVEEARNVESAVFIFHGIVATVVVAADELMGSAARACESIACSVDAREVHVHFLAMTPVVCCSVVEDLRRYATLTS